MVVGTPFLTVEQIQKKNRELADRISADYRGKNLLAVGILKGAFIFFSDLVRLIRVPLTIDFIIASSYLKDKTSGEIKIHYHLREDIAGRDVLLVEDIVDSGHTIASVLELLQVRQPNSLKVCALLDKAERREAVVPIHYRGFSIPNKFVFGYGLDLDEYYRNLPFVGVVDLTKYRPPE